MEPVAEHNRKGDSDATRQTRFIDNAVMQTSNRAWGDALSDPHDGRRISGSLQHRIGLRLRRAQVRRERLQGGGNVGASVHGWQLALC